MITCLTGGQAAAEMVLRGMWPERRGGRTPLAAWLAAQDIVEDMRAIRAFMSWRAPA